MTVPPTIVPPLTKTPEWRALQAHAQAMAGTHMRDLFARDAQRFAAFSLREGALLLDYSKNRITAETLALLTALARARGLEQRRDAMFAGAKINATEGRAALHVALRNRAEGRGLVRPIIVDGVDVMGDVLHALICMREFSERVRDGSWTGSTGKPIRHVVNIGIGGSHLGPMFVADALKDHQSPNISVAFVSNPDRAQIEDVLRTCDPAATLFTISSKTFTTAETMSNAAIAREWLASALGEQAIARHFAAVSTNHHGTTEFGIPADSVFSMWDWVGGRYSVWSAIGLPIAIACGFEVFDRLLAGAHAMDRHFETAPPERNMPVILALLGLWYSDFFDAAAMCVLPYDHRLKLLPFHLQQLDMESNGKGVTLSGAPVETKAGPIVFGGGGSDSQHSFFQLLHQSPRLIPCDFIAALKPHTGFDASRDLLLSNCFAQSEALMMGRTADSLSATPEALKPHRSFTGNRPSNTILLDALTPFALGQLIALYEHKVFVQGVLWGVNSFDQWGVELGKELAKTLEPALSGEAALRARDSSTAGLVAAYLEAKRRSV
ncbi:MAG: glucose-6-phosphate isomerase [Rhodospirillaceae bacterium]|nr:glucose-6-phosphate isomerase [Rhodospirillaceae bacterium]